MQAFLGISVWITLVTVCPGLVTIFVLLLALALVAPSGLGDLIQHNKELDEWTSAGLAVTVMLVTQLLGILLERVLVRGRKLGPAAEEIAIPEGIDPLGHERFVLRPYAEYEGVYLLLAELTEEEDSQGHLQRAIAQFFMTNNLLVSFGAGIGVTLGLLVIHAGRPGAPADLPAGGFLYLLGLCGALAVTYQVAVIRFRTMAKALWAARRKRVAALERTTHEGVRRIGAGG